MRSDILDRVNSKRFKSGIEFQKQLLQLTRTIQDQLLNDLPSNYSRDRNTNLAEFFRAIAKEFARLQISSSDVNENKYNTETQAEYLFQILGDSLFLGEKVINENLNDVAYRDFLLKVRNAYYEGSRKQNLEDAVSDIIGLPVTLKELYLELRNQNSFYGIKDTHKMFFDILMDGVTSASSVGVILEDIKFFIDIIKPAHTLYDTRLIWTDSFTNRSGECKPDYLKKDMPYVIYGASRIYQVTYLASEIHKFAGGPPEHSGIIQSIELTRGIFHLTDNKILVYDSNTALYGDGTKDVPVSIEVFHVGDTIEYYATKDAAGSSDVIDSTWQYSGVIDTVDLNEQRITMVDGSYIVFNTSTLAYTRDGGGEYRLEIEDLSPNREIAFKAEKNTQAYRFYRIPTVVQADPFRQFDSSVIEKPSFQEYVLKNKEIPPGTTEGYTVVVENGVAVVKEISSKFYRRANTEAYRETKVNKYNLYIDTVFQKQFELDDAPRTLTNDEAKNVFIAAYGYTGLQNPGAVYRIDIASTGRLVQDGTSAVVQGVTGHTEACDRKAMCQLVPLYEDARKYFTWPDLQLTSGFFDIVHAFTGQSAVTGTQDLPAAFYGFTGLHAPEGIFDSPLYFGPDTDSPLTWYYLSQDPNVYQVPYLPMLGSDGQPAEANDVAVYLDGRGVTGAINTVDPWNGIVSLNFIPPFDTKLRIDYYYSNRYPKPVYYLKQLVDETVQEPGDLLGTFSVINVGGLAPRLTWPFEVTDPALYGDDRDYQLNKFPMLNNQGELVTKDEISVFMGTTVVTGTLQVIGIGETGSTLYNTSSADWTAVQDGDTIVIQAENYLDNTLVYAIENVDLIGNTLRVPNSLPVLGATYAYSIVHFIEVADAVEDVRPLLGHVRLDFLPPANCYIRINYYYTPYERQYLMLPDAAVTGIETGIGYGASSYTPDTFYGPRNNYTISVDASPDFADTPYWGFDELLKVGYRYRAFNLAHSGVLDSEQLTLDDYVNSGGRASFNDRTGTLDKYNLIYSPEYLTDTDKNVVLNDKYLLKDLPAVTTLSPGTPIFAESFTDDAHHVNALYADEHDTYDPDLVGGRDLRAAFTIIEPDDSGIIDYNAVCEILDNEQINLYSDLKQVEFPNGGYDAHLTTIDEGGTSLPFKFTFIEQYYPNRELRLTDYLDYINQVPTEYRYGSIKILNGSHVAKSMEGNFKAVNVGDTLTVKDIPYVSEVGYTGYVGYSGSQELLDYVLGYGETGYSVKRYNDDDFTVVHITDYETANLSKPFDSVGGTYRYELTRSKTYAVDVSLQGGYGETAPEYLVGNLNRILVLNGQLNHTYSIPEPVLQHLPGYGDTGAHFELYFVDPDPDPYPRNPDNPWIPNPTGISYYNVTQYVIDGKTYRNNRINATTGLVRTSQIINASGYSVGCTGGFSGFTGPSGALDLGITGPVGDADPRTYKGSDSYVIPSGDTGIYLSYSEAEYRVQWRNWDQDILFVNLGVTGGVMIEDPINLMDDIGEGIKRSFWSVSGAVLREFYLQGTVVETSEMVSASVAASSYPNGLVLLTQDQVDLLNSGVNPATLHLTDANYRLNRRIVRELLHDDLVNVTEVQEFIPL